jgi:multicomponent Na+:H+ antiporter subunit B
MRRPTVVPETTPIVSLILRTATRYVFAVMLLLSIFLLLRGHNEPGGGFIGGLVAGIAFVLYAIAFDVESARTLLRIEPRVLVGSGLLMAAFAGIIALTLGDPFLTGRWATIPIPLLGDTYLGTPFIFDVGVYLVVIGITLVIVLTLAEE